MWLDLKYAILDYDVSGTIWISLVMIFFGPMEHFEI